MGHSTASTTSHCGVLCLLALLAIVLLPTPANGLIRAVPQPPFHQCPPVGGSASCQILLYVWSPSEVLVLSDPSVESYDGGDGISVGVLNGPGATTVKSIVLSDPGSGIALFDGLGLCAAEFGVPGCPFGSNPYAGPNTTLTTKPNSVDSVQVNFPKGLKPLTSTFFSLAGAPVYPGFTATIGRAKTLLLQVTNSVSDTQSWVDPNQFPTVNLGITVRNGDGTPGVGAEVKVSGSHARFVTDSTGHLDLTEPVANAIGPKSVTVTAKLGNESRTETVQLYDGEELATCVYPGKPSGIDTLSNYLEFLIPDAPVSGLLSTVSSYLSAVGNAAAMVPQRHATNYIITAHQFTGPGLTTIYALSAFLEDQTSGKTTKRWPTTYSREYSLVEGMFGSDGFPLSLIGSFLSCGGPVA
jgi:hypothetical protein